MTTKKQNPSFTNALKRLEEIVSELENPSLDLEEGLALLEEGVKLHKYCQNKLMEANLKISSILKGSNNRESEVKEDF